METTDGELVARAFGGTSVATVELVATLGLPAKPEIAELVEVGLETFVAAFDCCQPGIAADYLDFAASRLAVLLQAQCRRADAEAALSGLLGVVAAPDRLPAARSFLADVLELVSWAAPPAPSPLELPPLAREYLDLSLAGRGDDARTLMRDTVHHGTDVGTVLVQVLEPAQREIGRLWQLGQITVAQEHFCTAVTQLVMTDLEPLLFTGADNGRRLVAVDAPGSLHQVGMRMVVDLLEYEGWDTTYHGPASPLDVPELVHAHRAGVLAISVSMPDQIAAARTMISAVRSDPRTSDVKIVVGGRPFVVAPELAAAVGADDWARDALSAVATCEGLVAESA